MVVRAISAAEYAVHGIVTKWPHRNLLFQMPQPSSGSTFGRLRTYFWLFTASALNFRRVIFSALTATSTLAAESLGIREAIGSAESLS